MGHDGKTPRIPADVTLPETLLQEAALYTDNLSGTVETLLVRFVERERARRSDEDDKALKEVIASFNAFHEEHGLLSDDYRNFA